MADMVLRAMEEKKRNRSHEEIDIDSSAILSNIGSGIEISSGEIPKIKDPPKH
jgi:hypothetical protein